MKPKLQLLKEETIEYECQPQDNYIFYSLIARFWQQFLAITIIVFLAINYLSNDQIGFVDSILNELFGKNMLILGLIVIVLGGVGYFLMKINLANHWYFFTNQRCILYSGFINIQRKVLTYDNIVDVDIRQTLLHRILGIASVTLEQKGLSQAARGRRWINCLEGLSPKDADKIAHIISQKLVRG